MSQTDYVRPESFFAELIAPLRSANVRRNVSYLKLNREAETYWTPPSSRTGGFERVPAEVRDGAALLEILRRYWALHGDANLPKLVPYLVTLHREIVAPITAEAAEEPPVSDFVYPLF